MRKAIVKYTNVSLDKQITLELICWVDEDEVRSERPVLLIEECATGLLRKINNVESVQFLDKPTESAMQPLTPEQKEYIELKYAMDKMARRFDRCQHDGDIPMCVPIHPHKKWGELKYFVEAIFYSYLDRLIEEHKKNQDNKKQTEG